MFETIVIILLILWALGFWGGFVMGGFIHLLLVVAIILIVMRLITGKNPL